MYGCKFAAKSNAFFSQYGWVHLMLPKWVKSKLALTMFAFLSCQWAAICCSERWSCGWEKRDGDGLCAQKTHQPAPCLAPAPVSPQDRLGGISRGCRRAWGGGGGSFLGRVLVNQPEW